MNQARRKNRPYILQAQSVEWSTPIWLFEQLSHEFGSFDLDPAATPENAKAPNYYTIEENGLQRPWNRIPVMKVFCNPPYGYTKIAGKQVQQIPLWLNKALYELPKLELIVFLLPAYTSTKWYKQISDFIKQGNNHKIISTKDYSGFASNKGEVRFLSKRLKYGRKDSAGFASMVVIFRSKST